MYLFFKRNVNVIHMALYMSYIVLRIVYNTTYKQNLSTCFQILQEQSRWKTRMERPGAKVVLGAALEKGLKKEDYWGGFLIDEMKIQVRRTLFRAALKMKFSCVALDCIILYWLFIDCKDSCLMRLINYCLKTTFIHSSYGIC